MVAIRTEHGTEFDNASFTEFCESNGIDHNFTAPRTPQQNGVVERMNCTLEEVVYLGTFGPKQSTHLVMYTIELASIPYLRKLRMNFYVVENLTYPTCAALGVNVMFIITAKIAWKSLTHEAMKQFSWDMRVSLIKCLISAPWRWRLVYMLSLMKTTK